MADRIRVGLVGANARQGSWGARAHVPALQGLPEYELKAVCTTREETALEAAKAWNIDLPFSDPEAMFRLPDIDLVSVSVRVPFHHELVMAALRAGKPVFCEWPLGANLAQAREMANLAGERGLPSMVGLQGRGDPGLNHVRNLIRNGYIGEVLACNMTMFGAGPMSRTAERAATSADRRQGISAFTIQGGHSLDVLCFCLGEFVEVSGKVATQVRQWQLSDTGGTMDVTAPDNLLLSGVLESGALATVHVAAVPTHGSGWRLEVYGREGSLFLSGVQAHQGQLRITGSRGGEPATEIPIPPELNLIPAAIPEGFAFNVAQLYVRLARALRDGTRPEPDFAWRCGDTTSWTP
jgi:predicted dehydrogenase